jgi:lipopolysaccharide transport system permease protein
LKSAVDAKNGAQSRFFAFGSEEQDTKISMSDPSAKTIYTAEPVLRHPVGLFRSMARDLQISRELSWRLFLRNLRSQYRQSVLGYFWAVLPPLFTTLAFVFLSEQRILNIGPTNMPYTIYVLVGSVLWQGFVDALYCPLRRITSFQPILRKVNFPREAVMLAGLAEVSFVFAVRLMLVLVAFVWFDVAFSPSILLASFAALSLIALGFVIGIVLMPVGVLYRDVERALAIVTLMWFFLTPVVYPVPSSWPASILAQINPVTPLLTTARDLFAGQTVSHWEGFLLVVGLTFWVMLVSWVLYRVSLPHLVERMGG